MKAALIISLFVFSTSVQTLANDGECQVEFGNPDATQLSVSPTEYDQKGNRSIKDCMNWAAEVLYDTMNVGVGDYGVDHNQGKVIYYEHLRNKTNTHVLFNFTR